MRHLTATADVFAALKPTHDRANLHPAVQVSNHDTDNYFTRPGDQSPEGFGVGNGLALAMLLGLVAACGIILSRTNSLKFYSFFLLEKPYRKLELKPVTILKQSPPEAQTASQKLKATLLPRHLPLQV